MIVTSPLIGQPRCCLSLSPHEAMLHISQVLMPYYTEYKY